jgi:catechol 2,3-dioxygenase-like lactoylglutathione lyase family enzyme
MLQKAIPLLPALNMRATIDFYETRLGFKGSNMGSYAIVKHGDAEIHFYLVIDAGKFLPSTCIIYADNVEDLYTMFAGKDMLHPPGQMRDVKFGRKEFSIQDNNGNAIRFSKEFK